MTTKSCCQRKLNKEENKINDIFVFFSSLLSKTLDVTIYIQNSIIVGILLSWVNVVQFMYMYFFFLIHIVNFNLVSKGFETQKKFWFYFFSLDFRGILRYAKKFMYRINTMYTRLSSIYNLFDFLTKSSVHHEITFPFHFFIAYSTILQEFYI